MIRWKPAAATLALALVFATTLSAQHIGFTRMVIDIVEKGKPLATPAQ